jgi:hypothetical protein
MRARESRLDLTFSAAFLAVGRFMALAGLGAGGDLRLRRTKSTQGEYVRRSAPVPSH